MYAVIRAGGKQYRVAPGDVVKLERQIQEDEGVKVVAQEGHIIQFNDVLAVSGQEGHIGPGQGAIVSGEVVETGRSDKVLVFHFKRKKQYKKIFGHRQPFTAVRITEIEFDGKKFSAPDVPAPKKKAKPAAHAEHKAAAHKKSAAKSKPKAKAKAAKKAKGKKK